MNIYEAIIIYLAAGAPLAVLYFLRNRRKNSPQRFIGTFGSWIFWFPGLLFKFFSQLPDLDNKYGQFNNLDAEIGKRVREILNSSRSYRAFPAFRTSLERYSELGLAYISSDSPISGIEDELFEIAGHGNGNIGSVCLRRKNRSKLAIHQANAGMDLFHHFEMMISCGIETESVSHKLQDLFGLLCDEKTANLFADPKPELREGGLSLKIGHYGSPIKHKAAISEQ